MLSFTSKKRCGFRISVVDIVFILCAALITYYLYPHLLHFVWIIPITVAHFFLFCNVFRVRRNFELMWAISFCVNVIANFYLHTFAWKWVLLIQIPITITIITIEIKSPNYRGIFCSLPSTLEH